MKVTGVVRRIDELGRIVIPKEIRKSLRINNGENLEIYLQNDDIILKRFSAVKSINDFAQKLLDSIYTYDKKNMLISDTNSIIAVTGEYKKEILNKDISDNLITCINRREKIYEKYDKTIKLNNNFLYKGKYIINSIILNSDCIGLVIFLGNEMSDSDFILSNIISDFISKYLEC